MTFTKISAALLATILILLGINELGHALYHPHELEEAAYRIEVPETEGMQAAAEEEETFNLALALNNADASAGEAVARKCVSCHSFEEGGPNMTGPNLWDVVGRMAAAVDGFNYSNAMQEFDQAWTYENLDAYLENPRGYISGTAMSFAGLRNDDERVNMIAYMRTMSNDPEPLPEPPAEEPAETETAEAGDGSQPASDGAGDGNGEAEAAPQQDAPADGSGEPTE